VGCEDGEALELAAGSVGTGEDEDDAATVSAMLLDG